MKKILKITVASMIAMTATSSVMAKSTPKMASAHLLEGLDSNQDGAITHAELMANVKTKFDAFDKNGDGSITLEELPKVMPVPDEMKERMAKHKEKMQDRREKMKEKGKDMPEGRMEKRMGRMDDHMPTRMEFMVRHDRNQDEKVSLDEFSAKAIRMFKRVDANGDGTISKAEAESMKKHMRGKGKDKGRRGADRWGSDKKGSNGDRYKNN